MAWDSFNSWKAKVALVTGAGSGIGRAAALALNREGFALILAGRHEETLHETRFLAKRNGIPIIPIAADVSIVEDVDSLFDQVEENFGRLDVLFNNAGVGTPAVSIDELDIAHWNRCVAVNLTGSFLCARRAARIMKQQSPKGGRIINNGSVSSHAPRPNTVAYTATKHAITGLTKSISLDGRDHDIVCSQLDIGNADTQMAEKFKRGVPQASGDVRVEPVFNVRHCGDAVAYIAKLSLDTNIQFMTIMATKMPFIGRG